MDKNIEIIRFSNENSISFLKSYLYAVFCLRKTIINLKIDALITTGGVSQGLKSLLLLLIKKITGIQLITFDIATPFFQHPWEYKTKKPISRIALLILGYSRCVDMVVVNPTEELLWKSISKKINVTYIPNIISDSSISRTPYSSNRRTVLCVANFIPFKSLEILIKLWKENIRNLEKPTWKLVIVGNIIDLMYYNKCKSMVRASDRIELHSFTSDIVKYYSQAGIFAFPSRGEAFGLSIAEAQASGIPAIAFNCPFGGQELIIDNDRSGYLIDDFNEDKFALALQNLMDSSELREKFSHVSSQQGAKFYSNNIIPLWEKLLATPFPRSTVNKL